MKMRSVYIFIIYFVFSIQIGISKDIANKAITITSGGDEGGITERALGGNFWSGERGKMTYELVILTKRNRITFRSHRNIDAVTTSRKHEGMLVRKTRLIVTGLNEAVHAGEKLLEDYKSPNKYKMIRQGDKNLCVAATGAMITGQSLEEFITDFTKAGFNISKLGIVQNDLIDYLILKGINLNLKNNLGDVFKNIVNGSHTIGVYPENGGYHDVLITHIRAYNNGNLKNTFINPQVGTIKAYNINYKDFNNSWGIFQFSDKMLLFYILSDIRRLNSMNINEDKFIEMYKKYFNSFNPIETLKYIKEKRSKDKIFRKNNMDSLEIIPILNFSIDEACFEKMNYSYNTDTLKHCIFYNEQEVGFDCIVSSKKGSIEEYLFWDSTRVIKVSKKKENNFIYKLRVWISTGKYPGKRAAYDLHDIVNIKKQISDIVFILNGELCFYKNGIIYIFDNRTKGKIFRFDERYGKKFNRFHLSYKGLIVPGSSFLGK